MSDRYGRDNWMVGYCWIAHGRRSARALNAISTVRNRIAELPLNSGCRAFIVFQSRLRLQIRARRQSVGSVPQTRKKCSNLSFQESDFSSCHLSHGFEHRHFTKREVIFAEV